MKVLGFILMLLVSGAWGIPAFAGMTTQAGIAESGDRGDGHLTIYSYHLGEIIDVQYRSGDKYNDDAIKKIERIFRSRIDDKEHAIDIKLIELVDQLQDHFGAETVELISGYRSPELNHELKEEGVGVAENSLHLRGLAADIHFDEITEEAMADYARSLKLGGVGYYPKNDFIHVDTGAEKSWSVPDKKERQLIGMVTDAGIEIVTEKNIYRDGEPVRFTLNTTTPKKFTLEFFRHGEWKGAGRFSGAEIPQKMIKGFGKYRIKILDSAVSNEFYVKKISPTGNL